MPTNPAILHPPGHDTQNVLYWDPRLETFVAITRDREGMIADVRPELLASAEGVAAYRRHWRADPGPKSHRRVGQCEATARDLSGWTAQRAVLWADEHDALHGGATRRGGRAIPRRRLLPFP